MPEIIVANKYGVEQVSSHTTKSFPNLDPGFLHSPSSGHSVSLAKIVEKPYQYHAWTYACAKVIASNVSRLPKAMVYKDKLEDFIFEHEVLEVFESPNVYMPSSTIFWEAVVLHLELSTGTFNSANTGGQVFLVPTKTARKNKPERVNLSLGEIPDTIYPFNDDVIAPILSEDDRETLVGWALIDPVTKKPILTFKLNEIIRIHLFNPYDPKKGMSFFTPSMSAFEQDIKADVYNASLYDNDATIAGLLTTDQMLTDTQYAIYMKMWNNKYGGYGNSGKTAIIGSGLKYQQFGLSHVDMQYTEQKDRNLEQILACYGLNKIALGMYENINFATIKEGRKMLWNDTYAPVDRRITTAITNQWTRYIDKNLMIISDYSGIESLKKDFSREAKASKDLVEQGYPPSEAAKIVGIPLSEDAIVKYPWLDERITKEPAVNISQEEDKKKVIKKIEKKLTEEQRTELSLDYIKQILDPGEKEAKADLQRFFISQRNRMLDKVDEWEKRQEKGVKAGVDFFQIKDIKQIEISSIKHKDLLPQERLYPTKTREDFRDDVEEVEIKMAQKKQIPLVLINQDNILIWGIHIIEAQKRLNYKSVYVKILLIDPSFFLLNFLEENQKLDKLFMPLFKEQMKREKKRLEEELGQLIDFRISDESVDLYLKDRRKIINGINGTTFDTVKDKVNDAVKEAVETQATPTQAAKLIKEAISTAGIIRKNQATTIARTEIGSVSSKTRFVAFKNEGIEYHEWLNSARENVRQRHQVGAGGVGGIVVAVGSVFPIVNMRFPLDPRGDVADIINCNCIAIAAEKPN